MNGRVPRRTFLGAATAAAAGAGLVGCATAGVDPAQRTTPANTTVASTAGSPGPTATTPATPASPSSTKAARNLTTVMSGDLLWHNTLWFTAANDHRRTGKGKEFDFDPMFEMVKPIIDGADLAIAHNEVPFARPGGPYTGYPLFSAPPQIADWMATMGWDMATTASNHSIDMGFAGLERTVDLMRAAGLAVVGTWKTAAEAATPAVVTRAGVKVAVVSGTYGLNGLVAPRGKEWCVSLWDVDRMLADARAARAAGAEIVMAHLHGGEEYQTAPSRDQVIRATALANAPEIDLVFGEHVHVVQPITMINKTWVVYGMGNMVAQHRSTVPRGAEGITVRFTWQEQDSPLPGKQGRFRVAKAEYIPTFISSHLDDGVARLFPVNQALREGSWSKSRLTVARDRTRQAVHSLQPPAGLIEV